MTRANAVWCAKLAGGVPLVPVAWTVLLTATVVEAGLCFTWHVARRGSATCARWLWPLLAVLTAVPVRAQIPACLYLQHQGVPDCRGSYNVAACAFAGPPGSPTGQCPQEGGDTLTAPFGPDALVFRYSMPVPLADWGYGAYAITSKVLLQGNADTTYAVRLSRVSADCGTTYQVLGTLGPFAGPASGQLRTFAFPAVWSYRAATTDRLVIDFLVSGPQRVEGPPTLDQYATFSTSYGHAESVLVPFASCLPSTPTHAPTTATPTPELWVPLAAVEDLRAGDVLRLQRGDDLYVVVGADRERASAVRVIEITEPSGWLRRHR